MLESRFNFSPHRRYRGVTLSTKSIVPLQGPGVAALGADFSRLGFGPPTRGHDQGPPPPRAPPAAPISAEAWAAAYAAKEIERAEGVRAALAARDADAMAPPSVRGSGGGVLPAVPREEFWAAAQAGGDARARAARLAASLAARALSEREPVSVDSLDLWVAILSRAASGRCEPDARHFSLKPGGYVVHYKNWPAGT